VDHRLAPAVDLAPEVGDVELDHVGVAPEVVGPDPIQDLRLGQRPPRIAHQEPQQLELGDGQIDRLPRPRDLVRVLVQDQVADHELRARPARRRDSRPAHQPTKSGQQLLHRERLGDVVVRAGGDPGDAVLDRVASGEEQDAHGRVRLSKMSQHVQSRHVGQPHVQHDDVGRSGPGRADRRVAIGRGGGRPSLQGQHAGQDVGQIGLVLDDQGANRRRRRPQRPRASWHATGCLAEPLYAL
jgi:hypothetical protein